MPRSFRGLEPEMPSHKGITKAEFGLSSDWRIRIDATMIEHSSQGCLEFIEDTS